MSWPSLDTWRQSLFDAEDIIAMKPLNKKHSVWLVKYQGRQLVYKHTPEKSSRYNQGLATNSFQSIRGRQSRPLRVYVPQIVAPLGDATINQNGTDIGYNAFLMDYHPGDPLNVLIDQLVEFKSEAGIDVIVELTICVENVAQLLSELARIPKGGAIPDLRDTIVDIESGQTTLLDFDSNRARQVAADVLHRWIERLQELCAAHHINPLGSLEKTTPSNDFAYYARLASAFKLELQQTHRQRMRKILLGGRMKEIRKQQKHWMMPDNSSAGREPATTESATSDSETPRGGSPVSFVTRGGFQSPRAASPQLRALSPLAEARSPQFDDRPKPHHNKSTHRGHRQKSAEQQSKSPPPTDGAPQQQPTAGGGDGGPETSSMFPSGAPQEQDFPNPRGGDYVGWIEPMEMGGGDNKGFPGAGQRQVERPSSPSCSESERTSLSSSEWQSDGTVLADRSQHGGSSAAWDST